MCRECGKIEAIPAQPSEESVGVYINPKHVNVFIYKIDKYHTYL